MFKVRHLDNCYVGFYPLRNRKEGDKGLINKENEIPTPTAWFWADCVDLPRACDFPRLLPMLKPAVVWTPQ